jgi:hypothetical protein
MECSSGWPEGNNSKVMDNHEIISEALQNRATDANDLTCSDWQVSAFLSLLLLQLAAEILPVTNRERLWYKSRSNHFEGNLPIVNHELLHCQKSLVTNIGILVAQQRHHHRLAAQLLENTASGQSMKTKCDYPQHRAETYCLPLW